jgi:hypothetical protein
MKIFNTKEQSCFGIVYENFLLPNREKQLIFHNGRSLPESKNSKYPAYTFFDYYDDHYANTFIDKKTTPHIIITACGHLTHLENINYSSDIVDHLNQYGLNIYFYETIFIDNNIKKRQFVNSINSTDEIYETIKDSAIGFETNNVSNLYSFEFENLNNFVKKHNLKNVTVFVGDYKIEEYFQSKYQQFKISTHDIFLTSLFKKTTEKFNSYEYDPQSTSPSADTIEFKFWCGNRRYDGYRHLIVAYLFSESSRCSLQWSIEESPFSAFDFRTTKDQPLWGNFKKHLWFNFDKWKETDINRYAKITNNINNIKTSLSIDSDIENAGSLEVLPVPVSSYQSCFCAIVNEAKFAWPFGQFSEKTLNAIKSFRPFILAAPPRTLEYLKKYGIQTFDQFWDESYDQEENHEKRLIKVFDTIDYINSKNIEELRTLYKQIVPILEHNYNIITKIPITEFNG